MEAPRGGGSYFVFESMAASYGVNSEAVTSAETFTTIEPGPNDNPYVENIYVESVSYEEYRVDLPEPIEDTYFIVSSAIARQYVGLRDDLLFPLDEITTNKENPRYIPFYRTLARITQSI
jgi:hypothetical protein